MAGERKVSCRIERALDLDQVSPALWREVDLRGNARVERATDAAEIDGAADLEARNLKLDIVGAE